MIVQTSPQKITEGMLHVDSGLGRDNPNVYPYDWVVQDSDKELGSSMNRDNAHVLMEVDEDTTHVDFHSES